MRTILDIYSSSDGGAFGPILHGFTEFMICKFPPESFSVAYMYYVLAKESGL